MELISSIHAVAGMVVALTGLLQILLKKGGAQHAILGFTYLTAWLIVVTTGALLGSLFISLFGFFGFYMAFTGWRFAFRRRSTLKTFEKVVFCIGGIAAVSTLIWGMLLILDGNSFGWVGVVFGLLFCLTALQDIFLHIIKPDNGKTKIRRRFWVLEHLTRMLISYVAAMTAFTVINGVFRNDLLEWLVPSAVGIPLIFALRILHKRKLIATENKED